MRLTERDTQILEALTCCIRVATLKQLSTHWWQDSNSSVETARRRLKVLTHTGWLQPQQLIASVLSELKQPVCVWHPAQPEPDAGAVAWKLQSRWSEPARAQLCFVATAQAAKHFGGRAQGRLKRQYQATHDLGVTAVYLHLRREQPERAKLWIGEDLLAPYRKNQKLPDAILADSPSATPQLVIEFGGAYSKQRVLHFHHDCLSRGLPYELW